MASEVTTLHLWLFGGCFLHSRLNQRRVKLFVRRCGALDDSKNIWGSGGGEQVFVISSSVTHYAVSNPVTLRNRFQNICNMFTYV